MDKHLISDLIIEIIIKRRELENLDYSNPKYDDLEDALHESEDNFNEDYESYFEPVLSQLHSMYCQEQEPMLPSAYIGKNYQISKSKKGLIFEPGPADGLLVTVIKQPDAQSYLLMLPNPLRIVLHNSEGLKTIVWEA